MSQKALRRLQVFLTSTISKRIWSRTPEPTYCTSNIQNMDAVKTMQDLGYAFNPGKHNFDKLSDLLSLFDERQHTFFLYPWQLICRMLRCSAQYFSCKIATHKVSFAFIILL